MANKIIGIKLEVNTEQGKKLSLVFQETEKSADRLADKTKKLQEIEAARVAQIKKQQEAYTRLLDIVNRGNESLSKNSRGSNLAYGNATRAVEGYKRTVESTTKELDLLTRKQQELALTKRSFVTGKSEIELVAEERRLQVQKAQVEIANALNRAYAEQIAKIKAAEQAEQDKLNTMKRAAYFGLSTANAGRAPAQATPNVSTNYATGARNYAPSNTYNAATAAAQLKAQIDYENTIRDAGNNAALIKKAKYASDVLRIEQKLASDIAAIQQKVASGLISKGQGFEAQKQAVEAYGKALRGLPSLNEHIREHKALATHILEIIGLYRIMNFAINTILSSVKAIPKIGIQLESTVASLTSTVGSGAGMAAVMKALNEEAQRTGTTIDALRTSFRTFQASTSLAGESLESTWRMFTNINTVASALHLTTDQTNGVFLALAQIFNKTKVQSEELVKQLGNLLPGAFASFAAANKDLFKNSAELIAKMKLGVVTAHETVEKFTDYMAKRFKEAFELAAVGLNSNIGRMQTSFTLLGEAIYGTTRGPMLAFVKGTTQVVDYLTEAVKGNNNFLEGLKQIGIIITSYVIANLALMATKFLLVKDAITGATVAATAFKGSLAFLATRSGFIGTVVAGIALIGLELKNLADGFKEDEDIINDFFTNLGAAKRKAQEVGKIEFEIDADPAVVGVKFALEAMDREISKHNILRATAATSFQDDLFKEETAKLKLLNLQRIATIDELAQQRQTAREKIEASHLQENAEALDVRAKLQRELEIRTLRATGKEVEAARAEIYDSFHSEQESAQKDLLKSVVDNFGASSTGKIIQESNKITEEQLAASKQSVANFKTLYETAGNTKKVQAKELKDAYKEITETIKTASKEIATDYANNENNYKQDLISLKEYLRIKKEIIDAEEISKSSLQRGILSIATDKKDYSKVQQAEEELKRIQEDKERKLSELQTESYEKRISNVDMLRSVELDYYNAIGQADKAAEIQILDRYGKVEASLKRQIAYGDTELQGYLDKIQVISKISQIEASTAISRASTQGKLNLLSKEQERINILKNIGAISEFSAAQKMAESYQKEIALKEELIRIDEKALSLMTGKDRETQYYETLKNKIKEAKAEVENFRLSSDTVKQYFQTQLTPAFSNAFSGFISGSMNAQEAFASFAQDMVKRLADIAAQQLAQEIIGGLFGLFSGVGSSSSAGLSTATAGTTKSTISSFLSSGVTYANAEGGVNVGMGGGGGYILTSPTLYPNARPVPFATGGVLAGEAGPEAVIPLKHGKVGVELTGNSNSSSNIIIQNMNITLESKEDASSQEQADAIGKAVRANLKVFVQQELANAKRSGGQLNPTVMATTF